MFLFITINGFAQEFADKEYYLIDSLVLDELSEGDRKLVESSLKTYHKAKSDTSKIAALDAICENMNHEAWSTYQFYQEKLIQKALGKAQLNSEIKFLQKSLGRAFNNIGFYHQHKGNIPKSLEYYYKCLKLQEKYDDKYGAAISMSNIGFVYKELEDFDKALELYNKSLQIEEELNYQQGIATSLTNIGFIHQQRGEVDKALELYHKSLAIQEELGDKRGMSVSINNIGSIYQRQGDNEKALEFYQKGLKIKEEIGFTRGVAIGLMNIGYIHFKEGGHAKLKLAQKYYQQSIDMANEHGFPMITSDASRFLSKVYEKQGKGLKALEMYKLHIKMRDSINNEATQKATAKQEAKYEYEKQKVIDDAEHDKLLAIEQEEKEKQQILTAATAGGLGLVAVFLIFVFNRLRVTKKQKLVIEEQKDIVEEAHHELAEKNQEIMDSISYAKRIQSAILPPSKLVKENLKESFILYKPKDIVAGDFYWMESVSVSPFEGGLKGDENNSSLEGGLKVGDNHPSNPSQDSTPNTQYSSLVLFAAADCTGHGVPGAMVSVVCHNALNRSVREYGLTDPGEILTKTREIVIEEFEKSEEDVKDGMDIALCSLTMNSPLEGRSRGVLLKYAGAHNPLWIIRSKRHSGSSVSGYPESVSKEEIPDQVRDDEYELIELKANKQPIGKCDNPEPYTTHTIELEPGDSIYIFSDGYVDQFGGEKGKKFKAKAFRELLLSIQDKSMEEQKQMIDEAFENWKGSLEQIDDVCVIGVRV